MGKVLGEAKARVPWKLGLVRKALVARMMILKEESTVKAWRVPAGLLLVLGEERGAGIGSWQNTEDCLVCLL